MRISDWSSDVCSSDLRLIAAQPQAVGQGEAEAPVGEHREAEQQQIGRIPPAVEEHRGGHQQDDGGPPTAEAGCHEEAGEHDGKESENERSEEHTSELQSIMRISYAVLCLKKKKKQKI